MHMQERVGLRARIGVEGTGGEYGSKASVAVILKKTVIVYLGLEGPVCMYIRGKFSIGKA